LLQLALRLGSLARLGAEAIGKSLERRDLFLLVLVSRKLLLLARRLLLDIVVPNFPDTGAAAGVRSR